MPIIKSAKKRAKQNKVNAARNRHFKTRMQTMYKKVSSLVEDKKADEAEKLLAESYSAIDTACKKNLIHSNSADRKKSRLARIVTLAKSSKPEPKAEKKAATPKKAEAKKPTAKKETPKAEKTAEKEEAKK